MLYIPSMINQPIKQIFKRVVVQPGSIHALGAWGRRFESYLPDQLINQSTNDASSLY